MINPGHHRITLNEHKAVFGRAKVAAIDDIVLAMVDGEFTIKTLGRHKDGRVRLLPANHTGAYAPIEISG